MQTSNEAYIMDDQDAGLFRVNRRAFTDAECLQNERRRIFDKCWIYVGHESEVPHAGDYRSRNVVGRPMILVRGDDNVVRVLLNTCTHRGAMVCRQKSGNAKTFQCPYHAWTYNSRGQLIGVPGEDSYSEAFKREDMKLAAPRHVDDYRGFIFACFDPAAQSLYDYLAGAREYLDLVADQSELGMKIVAGQQSYSARANWKLLVENSYDGYHGLPTHQRYFSFLNDIMAITVRTFYPVSPDYMEVNAWALAPIDESAQDSALRLDSFLTFLGPGGFATPDDVEMLESCQRGFANREVEWSDISRGMKREVPSITDELQMRAFWRRWNQLMTAPQIRRARKAA